MSRYRCYLHRGDQIADTGVREFLQLRARDAGTAAAWPWP